MWTLAQRQTLTQGETMAEIVHHLSMSQLKRYMECPLQYKFAWIDKLKRPVKCALVCGKSFHKSYESNFKNKLQTKKDMNVSDLQEIFAMTYEEGIQQEEIEDRAELPQTKDNGVAGVKSYYETAKKIIPEMVEEKFSIEWTVPIIGFIDLVDINSVIVDYKFSKAYPSEEKLKYDIQRILYGIGYWQKTKKMPSDFQFHFIRALKKEVKVQEYPTGAVTQEQAKLIEMTVGRVYEQMKFSFQTGNFPPNFNAMACGWCGYSDLCKGGKW
jgi:hypothetical protein